MRDKQFKEDQLKIGNMFEQEFRTISGKPNGFSNLSPYTILFGFVFILIIGSSFVLSIKSEINSEQSQKAIIELSSSVKTLEEWKIQLTEKQKQDVQAEKLYFQIQNLKEQLSGYSQLITDFSVLKEKFESLSKQVDKLSPTSNGPTTTTTPNLNLDQIDLKIASAISGLKLDILNGQIENTKDRTKIKITQASLIGLPAQIAEFQEQKVQFALQKQIIQNLQTNTESALAQISQQAPLFVDIPNIKKNVLDLQTSLNDHIKQVNNVSTSTGDSMYQPLIYGPYISPLEQQKIYIISNKFATVDTTTPCILTVQRRAVITLIATGLGQCENCYGILTFQQNGIINLQEAGKGLPFGVSSFYLDWSPINYTQEFIVEAGTYEFSMAVGMSNQNTSSTIKLDAISFLAKVTY